MTPKGSPRGTSAEIPPGKIRAPGAKVKNNLRGTRTRTAHAIRPALAGAA